MQHAAASSVASAHAYQVVHIRTHPCHPASSSNSAAHRSLTIHHPPTPLSLRFLIQTLSMYHFILRAIMLASLLNTTLARIIVDPVTWGRHNQLRIIQGTLLGAWDLAQNIADGADTSNKIAMPK